MIIARIFIILFCLQTLEAISLYPIPRDLFRQKRFVSSKWRSRHSKTKKARELAQLLNRFKYGKVRARLVGNPIKGYTVQHYRMTFRTWKWDEE